MKNIGCINELHTFIWKMNFPNINKCFFFSFKYRWFEYIRLSNIPSQGIPNLDVVSV